MSQTPPTRLYRMSPRDLVVSRAGAGMLAIALTVGLLWAYATHDHGVPGISSPGARLVAGTAFVYIMVLRAARPFYVRFTTYNVSVGWPGDGGAAWYLIPIVQVDRFEVRRWSLIPRPDEAPARSRRRCTR